VRQDEILSRLPDACYSVSDYSGNVILIKKGETGYYSTPYSDADRAKNRDIADHLNSQIGVTWAQAQAMKAGSLFGWNIPAVDPDFWSMQESSHAASAANDPAYDDEMAFSLNNGEFFLYIQTCESGYDYTIYRSDYSEYDGGQLDEPKMTIGEAALSIVNGFSGKFHIQAYDADLLQEAVYEADVTKAAARSSSVQPDKLENRIDAAQIQKAEQLQTADMQEKGGRSE